MPSLEHMLVIVPHGILSQVPFPALRDCENPLSPWLLEKYTTSIAPSIQVLARCQDWWANAQKYTASLHNSLVVGNPEPMPYHCIDLPQAAREATAVSSMLQYAST